jgi:polyisoprenoid-binding protein YceI
MLKKMMLTAALSIAAASAYAAPQKYNIDPTHTQVHATYSHLGFSNIAVRFNTVEGEFIYDAEKPQNSKVNVTVPISSLDTGVEKFDQHMWASDLFDAQKFPTASFKSDKITAAGKGKYKMTGTLTIKGVSKPVTFDVALNGTGIHPFTKTQAVGFDAVTNIKRSEFGLGYAVPRVGDDVKLTITLEATLPKS